MLILLLTDCNAGVFEIRSKSSGPGTAIVNLMAVEPGKITAVSRYGRDRRSIYVYGNTAGRGEKLL